MPKRAADDSETIVASKKKAKQDADASDTTPEGQLKKDDEGNLYLDLGNWKRATVSSFKGRAQLNIREYYTDKSSGDVRPGKKGITLNPSQWTTLTSAVPALTEQLGAVQNEDTGDSSKSKKPAADKTTKSKKSEKPAKKKKKKEESEDEASDDD